MATPELPGVTGFPLYAENLSTLNKPPRSSIELTLCLICRGLFGRLTHDFPLSLSLCCKESLAKIYNSLWSFDSSLCSLILSVQAWQPLMLRMRMFLICFSATKRSFSFCSFHEWLLPIAPLAWHHSISPSASSVPLSLSLALRVGGSQPRITVSVVEVARPQQHRERGCCRGLGQGLLWASRFSWPGSRSLAENPCGQLVGVKTHSHSPVIPWTEVWQVQMTEQDIINKSVINHNSCVQRWTLQQLLSESRGLITH